MLSGEYAVLDGATCIGLPTKLGQKMKIKPQRGSDLTWKSYDADGTEWFKSKISLYDFEPVETTDKEVSKRLKKYLKGAVRLNCEFLDKWNGFKIETHLEFSKEWGLGSSSTVIDLIAQWADIDPLKLYFKIGSGSGYDIICAAADKPITYQVVNDQVTYKEVDLNYSFQDRLFFVYSGQKQSSNTGIEEYSKLVKNKKAMAKEIDAISNSLLKVKHQKEFNELLDEHENIVSSHTGFQKVKDSRFKDFQGSVKSLGAWGGDFLLFSSSELDKSEIKSYLKLRKMDEVIAFNDLIRC